MQRLGTNNQMINIQKIALIFILGLTVFSCVNKEKQTDGATTAQEAIVSEVVSAEVFQRKLSETDNAVILDVRTPEEVADGYIEGAINIDFRSPDFQTKINELDKNATYMVYCASGGRSGNTATLMKELKFKEVYDLEGGFKGWRAKGLPSVLPSN
jgi:rhodanese-related sulfurtransferase